MPVVFIIGVGFTLACENLGASPLVALLGLLALGAAAGSCVLRSSVSGAGALVSAVMSIVGFGLAYVFC